MNVPIRPATDPSRELQVIARAVARLSPSWQRPELFHEQKSEISGRLRRLAGVVDGRLWPPLMRLPAPVKTRIVRETRVVALRRYLQAAEPASLYQAAHDGEGPRATMVVMALRKLRDGRR
jgi:hypothetical protein